MSVATYITDNAQDSLSGQKRGANVETAGILSNLIGETSVTQRWVVCIGQTFHLNFLLIDLLFY